MDVLDEDLLKLVNALLAGFVASWVFFGLTPHPKTTPFERIVQALIFTAFVQIPLALVRWLADRDWYGDVVLGYWTTSVELSWSVVLALAFGFLAALCANRGQPHKFLSGFGITKRTAYPSEWSNAFNAARVGDDCEAILHLKDQRRLHGWILEFPERPEEGHFRIARAKWYTDEQEAFSAGPGELLISASEVEFVQFDAEAVEFTQGCGPEAGETSEACQQSPAAEPPTDGDSLLTAAASPVEPIVPAPPAPRCPDTL